MDIYEPPVNVIEKLQQAVSDATAAISGLERSRAVRMDEVADLNARIADQHLRRSHLIGAVKSLQEHGYQPYGAEPASV